MNSTDSLLLLHVAMPIGWIAMPAKQLLAAQDAALKLMSASDIYASPTELSKVRPENLLDAADAAKLLKIEPSWLLKNARLRRIPFVRIGKYIRFNPDELIEQCRVPAQ